MSYFFLTKRLREYVLANTNLDPSFLIETKAPSIGIASIADGDDEAKIAAIVMAPEMSIEELHPDDQAMMQEWEEEEPPLPPYTIDPRARMRADLARKKK